MFERIIKVSFVVFTVAALCGAYYLSNTLKLCNTGEIKFILPSTKIKNFTDLVNLPQFKDKLIVMDIWSITCPPCLTQLSSAHQFKQSLPEKGVEFLYVTCNNRFRPDRQIKWKEFINKKKLSGYHIDVDAKFFEEIWAEVEKQATTQITPRYVLIDQGGKIINNNAAGLGSPDKFYQEIITEVRNHLVNSNQ